MDALNICIIKPNKSAFSETFVQEHIDGINGNKKILYGGAFPVYDNEGNYLIKSKLGLLSYLIQKKILRKKNIAVRNKALVNYLKKEKIDVVFAEYGMVGAMVTAACKIADVPLVIHFHGADVHRKPTIEEYLPFYKIAFSYASAFISVSGAMTEELIKLGAPANKIFTSSCGVDTLKFPLLDISKSGRNFLSVGRFVEKKSPASVIKAFKIVVNKFPDARLWMVGDGPLFDETSHLVRESGLANSVTLTGVLKSDQIRELMKQSRCFLQHSVTACDGDKEGTPVTILEAGASGLAIVSTLHTGIAEAVVNGETGYLVPEHDVEGMAEYMIKIAADVDLAVRLGTKEAAHIRKYYDTRDRINTLNAILQNSVKKN